MADVDREPGFRFVPTSGGPVGRLAVEQYGALAFMRFRVFANSFRTGAGAFEFGARAISFVIYTFMGVGLGIGAGAAAYALVARNHLHALAIEFWVLCFLWQAISIVLASFVEQFDLSSLLRFPVNFASFFLLHLVFGIFDVSTLAGMLACIGIFVGSVMARPDLGGSIFLSLAAFAVFNILLVRAIFAWLDRWLAKRRSREIVSAIFLFAMLSLQLLNPVLHDSDRGGVRHARHGFAQGADAGRIAPWLKELGSVQVWLPPGLAAASIEASEHRQEPAEETALLSVMGLYALAAAAMLGIRLRAEYRGENLGEAPGRAEIAKQNDTWLLAGRGPVSAEIEKELHVLFRSMTQLYAVCVPPVMVVIIASLFRNGSNFMQRSFHMALPICVAYGLLGFTQLIYNNLGAEGKGIQLVFLFPVRLRTILLAKNLLHGCLYLLTAFFSGAMTALRLGLPEPAIVAVTVAWLAFALPANLAAGNVLSVMMAYRVNLGRIGRQTGSQANALLSMLIQTAILGAGAGVISLCAVFGNLLLAVPILLGLTLVSVTGWLLVLRNADEMANGQRDTLIARLAKAD
ncbi:MAG TPA: hypothetical protein VHW46_11820 [Terracidiphilus sp.]|nr:hypothetical protein [Terracidiphilus sp.]